MEVQLDLKERIGFGSNGVYIGFTASTAGVGETQEVLNWSYEYRTITLPSLRWSPICRSSFLTKCFTGPVGTTHAENCHAYGLGKDISVAGEESHFTIQAVDQFGYNITAGGNRFDVTITPTTPLTVAAGTLRSTLLKARRTT